MDWYLLAWRKFAQFNGRSRRKEYWMFSLINSVVSVLLLGGSLLLADSHRIGALLLMFLGGLYTLAQVVPSLSCGIRRLHDTGKSAWWLLLSLVPLGGIVLLVLLAIDSDPGPNQYGPNPKVLRQSSLSY